MELTKPTAPEIDAAQATSEVSKIDRRPGGLTADQLIERGLAYAKTDPWRLLQICRWMVFGRRRLEWELDFALRGAANDADITPAESAPVAALPLRQRRNGGPATSVDEPRTHPAGSATVTFLHSSRDEPKPQTATAADNGLRGGQYAHLVRALRPQQWAKNGLVFVPLLLGGQFADRGAVIDTVLAFLALSMIASSTYLINDLWDLAEDRRHWSKCRRPLASGNLRVSLALAVAPLGIILGLLVGALASMAVVGCLLAYVVVTLSYSLFLKRLAFVDVLVLGSLFTLRIALGMLAADVAPSIWLIAVSAFLFSSLGFAKRYVELVRVAARGGESIAGRGYRVLDSALVLTIGLVSGLDAVAMMAIYVFLDGPGLSFYASAGWLWAFPLLLLAFVSRVWLACVRDEADDDLVAFALADRQCLVLLMVLTAAFLLAWRGSL